MLKKTAKHFPQIRNNVIYFYRSLTLRKDTVMFQNVKSILFDLDGTLIDSMWMWKQIDIEFLGKYGIELPEGLQQEIEGMSFSETATYFKTRFNIPKTEEEILKLVGNKGFDLEKLQEDANSAETWNEIKNDIDFAYKHGINGTPSTMINGNVYVGVKPYKEFKEWIKNYGAEER